MLALFGPKLSSLGVGDFGTPRWGVRNALTAGHPPALGRGTRGHLRAACPPAGWGHGPADLGASVLRDAFSYGTRGSLLSAPLRDCHRLRFSGTPRRAE